MTANELKALAQTIKTESGANKNTANRIGTVLEEIVIYAESLAEPTSPVTPPTTTRYQKATISPTAPPDSAEGDEWISSVTGIKYTYMNGNFITL